MVGGSVVGAAVVLANGSSHGSADGPADSSVSSLLDELMSWRGRLFGPASSIVSVELSGRFVTGLKLEVEAGGSFEARPFLRDTVGLTERSFERPSLAAVVASKMLAA
jgi:hypothetical protein